MSSPARLPFLTKQVKITVTLGLAILAAAANSLNVPLFFGVDFIFGSIAVMLAIVFLGTIPAVFVAVVGGLVTLVLWGHPYALIIFTVEALVVAQLYRRGICNLIMADFAYWLIIGMPLILFFYHDWLGMEWQATFLITLKQPLNGLFNALIAGLILIGLQLYSRAWAKSLELESLRLANLLFHTMLTILMFVGIVAIIYESDHYRSLEESSLVDSITVHTAHLIKALEADPKANLSRGLELETDMAIAVVANDGQILSSHGKIVSHTALASQLSAINDNLYLWVPPGKIPTMESFKQSRYVVHIPLNDVDTATHLIIEKPAVSLVYKLEHMGMMLLLFGIALLALGLLLSFSISHLLTRALNKIEVTGRNLSTQIANGAHIIFPVSAIKEYASLSTSLTDMANQLAGSFENLRQHELDLEAKIKLKTSELKESQARLTFAIESAGDGIWDWNLNTNTVHYSPLWMSMLGYRENELPQHLDTFTSLIHPDDEAHVQQSIQDYLSGKLATFTIQTRLRCKNGSFKWVLSRGKIVQRSADGDPIRMTGIHSDITLHKQHEIQLEHQANYDALTELPNRTLFADRFQQAVAHSKRTESLLAICFLDLDDFKPINDNFGHEIGDKLLIEVAHRIISCIRGEDTVARMGGDEFAILLGDILGDEQCQKTMQRIHHSLAKPYLIHGISHQVTASSGVALYPRDASDIETLLRHADQAMYLAKQSGRNRYQMFHVEQEQKTTA